MVTVSLLLVFLSVVSFALALVPDLSGQLIRRRILTEVAGENRPTALSHLANVLTPLNRWLPIPWYTTHLGSRLEAAGVTFTRMQFLVLQEVGLATGALMYVVVLGGESLRAGWLASFLAGGWLLPYVWLGNRIQTRRQSISRDLPEVIDLLHLCIDAGIDFMNALGRVVREYRPCPTTAELGIMMQEVQVGKRRREALRAFAIRLQTPETSSFARVLIQADRMGTGIVEALRILSEDMRLQRANWAERFAQQAPLKMLLPLLLSMAAALIIVAGPILVQFLQGGFGFTEFGGGGPQ